MKFNLSDRQLSWLFFATLFLSALRPMGDFDTFWQLQSGKYIWQTKAFLYCDTFSLAHNAFRLEHCWLSDVAFYGLYSIGGYTLLSLIKPILLVPCGVILYRRSRQCGVPPVLAVPVLLVSLLASSPSWVERPQLWTFLFSLLYLKLLFDGRENGLRSWGWLVPLMILWANLHAGAVFGLVLIGLFWGGELWRALFSRGRWLNVASLAGVGAAALGASFVNPYGSRIPLQLLAHFNLTRIGGGQESIMEWLPPSTAQVPLFYVLFAVWGVLILVRCRRSDHAEVIFFAAFCYMGWNQVRHAAFVPLLAGFFLPAAIHEGGYVLRRIAPSLALSLPFSNGVIALLLVFVVGHNVARGEFGVGLDSRQFPVAATTFVETHRLPPNLYNFYDWGGYLMWRLYPHYLVFVDGRNTSLEMLEASNRIDNSWQGWRDDLARYGVQTVISRTCYYDTGGPVPLVETLAADPEWALVFADEVAVVFVRRDEGSRRLLQTLEIPAINVYRTMQAEAERLYREDRSRNRVLLSLGRSSLRLGQEAKALRYYSEYLAHSPENQEANLMVTMLRNRGVR
uniref:TPR domain protein n=1 Tax=Geobacter metallireducens TaxID=28232 RepID=A0A831XEV0_GEOME